MSRHMDYVMSGVALVAMWVLISMTNPEPPAGETWRAKACKLHPQMARLIDCEGLTNPYLTRQR